MSKKNSLWTVTGQSWASVTAFGYQKREYGGRRSTYVRSYSYTDIYSSKIQCCSSSRIHQKQECNSYRKGISWEKDKIYWSEFWARGYFVSTVDRDEETIRQYIKKQEAEDRRIDQLQMF